MFERFTEHARRAIFFARYEASSFGSPWIDTEHLLLGLIREDKILRGRLPGGAGEAIRERIEASFPFPKREISTSVDLPLSSDSQRALSYGVEEADKLSHKAIDCGHLLLGLLRIENCAASMLLRDYGIGYQNYIGDAFSALPVRKEPPSPPPLTAAITPLQGLVDETVRHLAQYPESYGERQLKRKNWTRKQAFGHLVDWAVTHQQWFARSLTEPALVAEGYPLDEWVAAQEYRDYLWKDIVDLWLSLNRFLIHVLAQIQEDKLSLTCRIGVAEPIPLSKLIERYVEHCTDVVGQILARL